MAAVAELAALLRAGEPLPSLAAPEIETALASAEKGIVLGRRRAAAGRGADRHRGGGAAGVPGAAAGGRARRRRRSRRWPRRLDPPRGLARTIGATFDASGEISDAASPELARLREERKGLAENARGAIERLMRSEEYASVLQDQFFTVRAERYVLPLKASAKSLGLGIVHDTSRTGETVFVEPTALVAANNRLKVVELDIRRESRRILEALTADVAAVAPALRKSADGAGRARRARGGRAAGRRLRRDGDRDRRRADRRSAPGAPPAARARPRRGGRYRQGRRQRRRARRRRRRRS